MSNIIEFLTSREIMVIYALALTTGIVFLGIYLNGKNKLRRQQKQNTKELNKIVEEVKIAIPEKKEEHIVDSMTSVVVPEVKEAITQKNATNINKEEIVSLKNQIEEAIVNEVAEEEKKEEIIEEIKPEIIPVVNEKIVAEVKPEEVISVIEPVKEEVLEIEPEDEIEYTDIEPKQEEAKLELEKLVTELSKAEEATNNIELTSFEEEQEENAIISLEELLKKGASVYEANEINQYDDEEVPISLKDLEKQMNNMLEQPKEEIVEVLEPVIVSSEIINEPITNIIEENPKIVLQDFNTIKDPVIDANELVEETKKIVNTYKDKNFTSSPVISPVYGIELKDINDNDLQLENTANYEKLDEEIKKTNEFLATLKELQKKLD